MQVTSIKAQRHLNDRYSIYVDGKYAFSLSADSLLGEKITLGQQLTSDDLENLKSLAEADKAYLNALRFLAIRSRSRWEMEQYLKRKKLDKLQSQNILNKLSELKLLDDYAFAKRWVEGRRTLKPISRRRLIQELRAKRLDNETIEAALNEDDTDELDVLRQLVSKKMALSRYKADPLKLKQYLSRQGYSYEDIKSVMNSGND